MSLDADPPPTFAAEYADPHHAVMDWRLGYSRVLRLAGELAGRRVLDYGCGTGRFARVLAERGAKVTGVDIDAAAIAAANARGPGTMDFHLIASAGLPMVAAGSIDLAVAAFVLCCVRTVAELGAILSAVRDRLAWGGRFIVLEPHPGAIGHEFVSERRDLLGRRVGGAPVDVRVRSGGGYHDYWHARADYESLFAAAGFATDAIEEPLAVPAPGESFWRNETFQPPFVLFRLSKLKLSPPQPAVRR
ncbi:MAG: Ubiquinone/menaquinone biosynthesis C-methyltransferase UbiE [Phycisphaerae bacterium]|nr:Ubiquinone/menaquinone biosynthesis C-methyltransferase UbiE [Phycisphaerae bacterium]